MSVGHLQTIAAPDLRPATRPFPATVRAVALGGGTGLPVLLRGLKTALFPRSGESLPLRERERLTAIVTVADDGGSSGRLREAYGLAAPGDIRNCLLALSGHDGTMAALFGHRFAGEAELGGHSLGNLIIAALSQIETRFARAVERAGEILDVRGRVLPASVTDVRLLAEFTDGSSVAGESSIAARRRTIERVRLEPPRARVLPAARAAIEAADLVVLGPGSLYTSLIPVLLIPGIAQAIERARARVVLVMNLMTEPGETDGYTAADHVRALRRHAPRLPIHHVLVSAADIPSSDAQRDHGAGARPLTLDLDGLRRAGCRPCAADLLAPGLKVRHDPHKLAAALLHLAARDAFARRAHA